jgi:hypothetical protein
MQKSSLGAIRKALVLFCRNNLCACQHIVKYYAARCYQLFATRQPVRKTTQQIWSTAKLLVSMTRIR